MSEYQDPTFPAFLSKSAITNALVSNTPDPVTESLEQAEEQAGDDGIIALLQAMFSITDALSIHQSLTANALIMNNLTERAWVCLFHNFSLFSKQLAFREYLFRPVSPDDFLSIYLAYMSLSDDEHVQDLALYTFSAALDSPQSTEYLEHIRALLVNAWSLPRTLAAEIYRNGDELEDDVIMQSFNLIDAKLQDTEVNLDKICAVLDAILPLLKPEYGIVENGGDESLLKMLVSLFKEINSRLIYQNQDNMLPLYVSIHGHITDILSLGEDRELLVNLHTHSCDEFLRYSRYDQSRYLAVLFSYIQDHFEHKVEICEVIFDAMKMHGNVYCQHMSLPVFDMHSNAMTMMENIGFKPKPKPTTSSVPYDVIVTAHQQIKMPVASLFALDEELTYLTYLKLSETHPFDELLELARGKPTITNGLLRTLGKG